MPLPWKKGKTSRISRFVADLQPSKPANSSLVVETGFPTSLVDLFVKNRDRLKKPIKKKKKHHPTQFHHPQPAPELVISDPIPLSSSRDLVVKKETKTAKRLEKLAEFKSKPLSKKKSEVFFVSEDRNLGSCGDLKAVVDSYNNSEIHINGDDGKNGKCVLMAVLKMFVVVVLALSTKRLAVGITLSASFLIFLEYVGKRFFCFLKPCFSVGVVSFKSLIQRVLFFFRIRRRSKEERTKTSSVLQGGDEDDEGDNVIDGSDLIESVGPFCCIEETRVSEPRLDKVSRLEGDKSVENETIRDLLRWNNRWGTLDMDEKNYYEDGCGDGGLNCEKQHGISCKMRRKIMKKLVPKKLRKMKKGKKEFNEVDLVSETSSYWGEDKLWPNEDAEEQQASKFKLWQLMVEENGREDKKEEEEMEKCWKEEGKEEEKEKYCQEEEKVMCTKDGDEKFEQKISSFSTGLHTKSDKIVVEETVDIENGGNSAYLILFLIVLAGLVGGRVLALLITVASCSMLKFVYRRRRRVHDPTKMSPMPVEI
ncbi:uncharacterized protein LOC126673140 [Mercurialis annua]|uniref:uncharacterized protein LOC126673140 n=1 Tax=Mercurialis annua TaxID=3986 RepID=UPI00215FE7C4|nr:uncharacterized protein LOC126673140 [Mercurialis annua]